MPKTLTVGIIKMELLERSGLMLGSCILVEKGVHDV